MEWHPNWSTLPPPLLLSSRLWHFLCHYSLAVFFNQNFIWFGYWTRRKVYTGPTNCSNCGRPVVKKRVRCDLSGNQSQRCASFFSTASTKLAFRTHLSVIFLCFLFLLLLPRLNFQVHTSKNKNKKTQTTLSCPSSQPRRPQRTLIPRPRRTYAAWTVESCKLWNCSEW